MKLAEAIIKSLDSFAKPTGANDIGNYILVNQLWDTKGSTPLATIQARLGDFIREGDNRVKRTKENGVYFYYLAKNEQDIKQDVIVQGEIVDKREKKSVNTYHERDLHKLLATYLKNENIYSKTIYHEESNRKDENQKWTHPDMIGIRFLYLQSKSSQNLLKAIDKTETFKLFSYELKREINNDYELKKAYFQAVSNSSWANYGYLAAFEIGDNLKDEMERLNQSFGIGVILLNANPFQSKILFQARYKSIDFKTVDKLCNINDDFKKFIEQTEKLLTAEERYYKSTEKELDEFCDKYFKTDTEIEEYCKEKHIPMELDEN
ncbi:HrgA protein [Bacteroidia bacterium]|nr:HrgA protein [Bacteroidia bacterium]